MWKVYRVVITDDDGQKEGYDVDAECPGDAEERAKGEFIVDYPDRVIAKITARKVA